MQLFTTKTYDFIQLPAVIQLIGLAGSLYEFRGFAIDLALRYKLYFCSFTVYLHVYYTGNQNK